MEEVDNIIIHSLKAIGCDIDDEVVSLKQFTTELIVEATVRCIRLINNDPNLSWSLPGGMSARFRICTALANTITELGYTGEIGYQSFLYSNDADVRKFIIFLLEKLPRAAAEITEETLGASVLLYRSIASELAQRLSSPWVPAYLRHKGTVWRGQPARWKREGASDKYPYHSCPLVWPHKSADITIAVPKDVKIYQKNHMTLVTKQPASRHDVAASVLEQNALSVSLQHTWDQEWNSLGLTSNLTQTQYHAKKREKVQKRIADHLRAALQKCETNSEMSQSQNLDQILENMSGKANLSGKTKGSRFTHAEKLQFTQDDKETVAAQVPVGEAGGVREQQTQEELQEQRENDVKQLRGDLDDIESKMEQLEVGNRKFVANREQMEEDIESERRKTEEQREAVRVKRQTVDLLSDAEGNIGKLQAIIDNTSKRLTSLADQWEKHRVPLIDQYRELKELNSHRMSEAQKKLEEIQLFRQKMKDLADETRLKEDLHKQLVSEYERMTKDVNRSAYTRKIMEIVANIKKQKEEINKVLLDTRSVQKDINSLQGKLGRTFTVADELIFKNAKKDEAVKRAYKYLAALHEGCDQLIDTVEETGVIMREIRDLEEQIEQENSNKLSVTLERITADLHQMKTENMSLVVKMKAKSK